MKAIIYTKYGSPDVLQLKEVDTPTPKDNEVLVKIHAASLNVDDLERLKGIFWVRLGGLLTPKYQILGSDIAGRVEAVGGNVKQFQPSDEVFGDLFSYGFGAFAEYVCVPETALALKPGSMTFEEAATIPSRAIIALQGLRDIEIIFGGMVKQGPIRSGEKFLMNGAGGGVGTFAVQLAKYFGADVTGVDRTEKLDMLRKIGADHVIDYTQEDFTKLEERYDLILDVVAHHSIFDYKRVLSPKGIYLMVGGSISSIFQAMILGPWISRTGSKKIGLLNWKPFKKEDASFLKELIEASKVVPIIDRCYSLSEVPEALRYLEKGHHHGKLVITVEHNNKI